jgi:hypothetical protein
LAGQHPGRALVTTIIFISLSAAQYNLEADWADADATPLQRRCPLCLQDSIVGHDRRSKQAHDQDHDWIPVRRGQCNRCGKTFTFLPPFSLPYTHYSLFARSEALQRHFVDNRSLEDSAPTVKDPNRVADPSTLRRWFRSLDNSRPPFSFLRRTMHLVSEWIGGGTVLSHAPLPLNRQTLFPFLARYWPLRL